MRWKEPGELEAELSRRAGEQNHRALHG